MTWQLIAFVALVAASCMVYTSAVFILGLAVGVRHGWESGFKSGWESASANQVDQARIATLDRQTNQE